jgi:hypothetical protein
MRKLLLPLFMALFLLSPHIAAAGPLDDLDEVEGHAAAVLWDVLAYLPWIAEGEDNGQYVYILYSPTCPYSEQIYKGTRNWKGDRPQLRWILLDPELELNSVYESPTPEILAMMFEEEAIPEDKRPKRNERINVYTQFALSNLANNKILPAEPEGISMPTFILGSREKIWVQPGYSDDWRKVFAAAPKGTAADARGPNIMLHADEELKILPVQKGLGYANETGEKVMAKIGPFDDAPSFGALDPGATLPGEYLVGVTEDGYVLIGHSDARIEGVVKDPQFVQKALKK